MPNFRNLIAKQLAQLRVERGLTQQELAEALQSQGYPFEFIDIVLLETDRASVTDMELQQLVNFFGTSYDYLIEGTK